MKGGDLSSQLGPIVGIKFENVVYNFGKVNTPGKSFLEYLVSQGNINIYLLTLLEERKVMAWCYKWGIPYSRVIQVESTLEIPEICLANHFMAYYDTDNKVLEAVGTRGAMPTKAVHWEQSYDDKMGS